MGKIEFPILKRRHKICRSSPEFLTFFPLIRLRVVAETLGAMDFVVVEIPEIGVVAGLHFGVDGTTDTVIEADRAVSRVMPFFDRCETKMF